MSKDLTEDYFEKGDIKVGDRLNEMLSFFINVISVGDKIVTLEGHPNGKMEIREYAEFEDFKKKCAYSSIPGYWVRYTGNDLEKVKDWLHHYKNNYYKHDSIEAQRQLSIEKILYSL